MSDLTVINDIATSRETIMRHMQYIGYETSKYENVGCHEIQIYCSQKHTDMLNMSFENSRNPAYLGRVFVFYNVFHSAFRVNNMHDIVEQYKLQYALDNKDTIVIINKDPPNDTIQKLLKQLFDRDGIFIVVHSIAHLLFVVHDHSYVPKHEVLTKDEHEKVIQKWKADNLPVISRYDPVARAILLRPGSICRIERASKSTILEDYYYRYCI